MAATRIVFVYNVDASPLALMRDLHQSITTGSTDCSLCDITFGRLLKDRRWSDFIGKLPLPAEFRMRSTFRKSFPNFRNHRFPAAFLIDEDGPQEFIDAADFEGCNDLVSLQQLVTDKLRGASLLSPDASEDS